MTTKTKKKVCYYFLIQSTNSFRKDGETQCDNVEVPNTGRFPGVDSRKFVLLISSKTDSGVALAPLVSCVWSRLAESLATPSWPHVHDFIMQLRKKKKENKFWRLPYEPLSSINRLNVFT